MKVACVGDNCMDEYRSLGRSYPGGNAVNVAVYLQRLGVDSSYVGFVGDDENGRLMIDTIRAKGVDVSHVHRKSGKTAVTQVELIDNNRVLGEYDEGVMAQFSLSIEDEAFIVGHEFVHSAIWGRADQYFSHFHQNGLITSFDFSDKLDHPLVLSLPAAIDYSFFSYTQDDSYIRSFLEGVHAIGSKTAIAMLGENGSLAFDGTHYYVCGIENVGVVDTMGAGDSFIAGFLYGVANQCSIEECLRFGTKSAARTITYFGAW